MTPQMMYRQRQAAGWTRIEMLLAIYDAAISAIGEGVAELSGAGSVSSVSRLKSQKALLVLLEGIDPEAGEVAASAQRLVAWCVQQIQSEDLPAWEATSRVLQTLRSGFAGIHEEANRLEQSREIPALDWTARSCGLGQA